MSGPGLTDLVPVVVKEALETDGSELRVEVERAVESAVEEAVECVPDPSSLAPASFAAYDCTDFQVGHKIFINEVSLKVDALPQTINGQHLTQGSKDPILENKGINKKKLLVSAALLLAITIAVCVSVFVNFHPEVPIENFSIGPATQPEEFLTTVNGSFVPRQVWRASSPRGKMARFEHFPLDYVIIAHTASLPCFSIPQCSTLLRNMQETHFSVSFSDIAYNFMVGGDGHVYVGRGWDWQGAHTRKANRGSIGIGVIGNFVSEPPPQKQVDAIFKIIEQGLAEGKLSKDYKIVAQNQINIGSASPGKALIEKMESWDHKATSYP